MNIIFFSRREGRARHLNLSHPITLVLVTVLALGLLAGTFALGVSLGARTTARLALRNPVTILRTEQAQIAALRDQLQDRVDALAMRLGTINAHLLRLNALGKRLTEVADIDSREFDFDHDPAVGGPEEPNGRAAEVPDLSAMIDQVSREVDARSAQFAALETVMVGRQLSAEIKPSGRPVRDGYISSYFGQRMDPFTGEEAIHKGLDFASESGSDVLAVASGIVTWAGPREGYGNLVEINHGNGLVTRYGHDATTLVHVGDEVERGQAIATVGSTGRSTGPHVHFEVLRNGQAVDPMSFVGH